MEQTSPVVALAPHSDLAVLTRPYTLLIAIPTEPNLSTLIGYCTPSANFQLHTLLTAAQVQHVQSYQDFGLVRTRAREPGVANFFFREIQRLQTSSHDAQMVSRLVAGLQRAEEGMEFHISSIRVLGEEGGDLVPEGYRLLWKWAKPQSLYQKSGSWNHSLTQVIEDAEWTAGKEISILVKSVDEDEYERVVRG